jgi:hypothetical protein
MLAKISCKMRLDVTCMSHYGSFIWSFDTVGVLRDRVTFRVQPTVAVETSVQFMKRPSLNLIYSTRRRSFFTNRLFPNWTEILFERKHSRLSDIFHQMPKDTRQSSCGSVPCTGFKCCPMVRELATGCVHLNRTTFRWWSLILSQVVWSQMSRLVNRGSIIDYELFRCNFYDRRSRRMD